MNLFSKGVKFIAVGLALNMIGFGLFSLLSLFLHYLLALLLSYWLSLPLSAFVYWRFVFDRRSGFLKSLIRYSLSTSLPIAANFVGLPIAVEVFGASPLVSQALIAITLSVAMFVIGNNYSFRTP